MNKKHHFLWWVGIGAVVATAITGSVLQFNNVSQLDKAIEKTKNANKQAAQEKTYQQALSKLIELKIEFADDEDKLQEIKEIENLISDGSTSKGEIINKIKMLDDKFHTHRDEIEQPNDNEEETISVEREEEKRRESLSVLTSQRTTITEKLIPFFNDFQMVRLNSNNQDIKDEYLDYQRKHLDVLNAGINLLNDHSKTAYQRNTELKTLLDTFNQKYSTISNLKEDLDNNLITLVKWEESVDNQRHSEIIESYGTLLKRLDNTTSNTVENEETPTSDEIQS